MSMECPSISMALVPILVLALAASSSNVYSSVASVVATTERGPPELIIVNQVGRDGDKAYFARSGHDPVAPENADVEDALKRGLATLKVTKCEAMRLKPIKDVVSDGWENGDAHLTLEHLGYTSTSTPSASSSHGRSGAACGTGLSRTC
nr:unnamed protein product [Digitaria exilis]